MTRFLARLDDRINPIVVKEARQAVNSRLVGGALLLFLAVQVTAMMLMMTGRETGRPGQLDLRAGREVFLFVQGILLGTCMLLIPALTGARLAAERSDVNVDLLFISSLTPRAVLAGKLAAAAAVALLIFSACAPFMAFAYVLRGLDVPTILVVLVADFLAVLAGTMFTLFLAAIPASRGFRVFLGLGGIVGLGYVFAGALAGSAALLEFELRMDTGSWEFWAGFGGLAAAVLGLIGLMFVWSVALISPPAANRALPVRVYTLGFWAAAAVGCGLWAGQIGHPGPVIVWGMFGAMLFSLQMLIAVCEREEWGPRVARRIPRRPLARIPAFAFYSGAAGGIVFAAIGGVLTVGGMALWHELELTPRARDWSEAIWIAGMILGYAYCYCLTAVLVRRLARHTAFRPAYTWVVALILFGLGCTLPFIARYALFPRQHRYGYPDEEIWLYLPNPVVMVEESMRPSALDTHFGLAVAFLAVWGLGMTIINGGWLVRQVGDFHLPKDREEDAAEERAAAEPGTPG